MQIIKFSIFGGPEVLNLEEVAIPQPAENEVLIKVAAAGINPIDAKIREGSSFAAQKIKEHLPSGLGYELVGEIAGVGKQITQFKLGDKVFGFAGFPEYPKCYAEYVTTTVEHLTILPSEVDILQAATIPLAGLTALQSLQLGNNADNWSHKKVLILAGAGGVGHIAVQLAHLWGVEVITTASAVNHSFLYELGANQCIDYHDKNITMPKVDLVLDLVGGEVGLQALDLVRNFGCFITVPTISATYILEAAKQKGITAKNMLMQPNMQELSYLVQLISSNQLKIEISKIFQLSEAQKAHEAIQSHHSRGKLVFNLINVF